MAGANGGERLMVATRKGLFLLERGAGGWRVGRAAFLGDNVSMTLADPRDGALYAALDHGHFGCKLHRSEDGGATWTELAAPAYPPQPEAETEEPPPEPAFEGETPPPVEWKLKLVWELSAGGADEPGLLWAGTIPGGLFRSTDRGASWDLLRSLWDRPERRGWFGGGADKPGIHSVLVDPRDSRRVTVGVSCGGVWRSADGGETWSPSSRGMRAEYMPPERAHDENVQDPHRVAACASDPDVLWVQHHNGIFRSTDAGASWTELEGVAPSAFGFGVAAHPKDPRTAWFVPGIKDEKRYPVEGRLCVTRTRDGGRSFEALRGGLPQEHCYDLVYRHALAVDGSGERLAFGSTTGGLWTSDDGGERWTLLPSRLPPIYCVRFA